MAFVWEPLTGINLILCAVIFLFGLIGYRRARTSVPLLIGIAFGLFGVSHLASLLSLTELVTTELIALRTVAYLLVAFVLFLVAFGK